jgi:hypothetical protein
MSRLTITVDAYFTAENAGEAMDVVAQTMNDIEVALPGRPLRGAQDIDVVGIDAEKPVEMAP